MKITAALGPLLLTAACAAASSPGGMPSRRSPARSPATIRHRPTARPSPTQDAAQYAAAVCASWGLVLDAITSDGDALAAAQQTDELASDPPPGAGTELRADVDAYVTALANGAPPTNRHAAPVTHACQSR